MYPQPEPSSVPTPPQSPLTDEMVQPGPSAERDNATSVLPDPVVLKRDASATVALIGLGIYIVLGVALLTIDVFFGTHLIRDELDGDTSGTDYATLILFWIIFGPLTVFLFRTAFIRRSDSITIGSGGITCTLKKESRHLDWDEIDTVGVFIDAAIVRSPAIEIQIAGTQPGLPHRTDLDPWRSQRAAHPYTHALVLPRSDAVLPAEALQQYAGEKYRLITPSPITVPDTAVQPSPSPQCHDETMLLPDPVAIRRKTGTNISSVLTGVVSALLGVGLFSGGVLYWTSGIAWKEFDGDMLIELFVWLFILLAGIFFVVMGIITLKTTIDGWRDCVTIGSRGITWNLRKKEGALFWEELSAVWIVATLARGGFTVDLLVAGTAPGLDRPDLDRWRSQQVAPYTHAIRLPTGAWIHRSDTNMAGRALHRYSGQRYHGSYGTR